MLRAHVLWSCALSMLVLGCNAEIDESGLDSGPPPDAPRADAPRADAPSASDTGTDTPVAPADAPPIDPLEGIAATDTVDTGYMFLEGPQWLEATGELVFSDIPATTIYVLRADGTTIEPFRMPSGSSNGLAVDDDGCLLAAEHTGRRISIACPPTAAATTVVGTFEGTMLNSPNDLVVRSDGTIYFTDPPYGLTGPSALGFMGLFRLPPGGTLAVEDRGALTDRPNGVVLSPDESRLYVGDSEGDFVRVFDVAALDGALSNERMFVPSIGTPDGMTIDVAGNLYVASSTGVRVFAPSGEAWGVISVPEQPANCAFGGTDHRTLYITAQHGLYSVELPIPGVI